MARATGRLPDEILALPASRFALNDALLEQAERETIEDLNVALMKAGAGDKDPLGVGRVIMLLSRMHAEGA